jgi:hypothetical protein
MSGFLAQLPCDAGERARFRRKFRAWLRTSEVPPEIQENSLIAAHVAAAVESGASDEPLWIHASVDERVIAIDIDAGPWLPDQYGDQHQGLVKRLSLIRRLAKDVAIQFADGGTIVHIRQPL